MRDWISGLRIVWELRRAERRRVRLYLRYGPSYGASPEEIRDLYRGVADAMMRAITGR